MIGLDLAKLSHDFELFRGLEPADLAPLADRFQRKTFGAGTLLLTTEQAGEVVYVILEGCVKVFLNREDGSEVIFAILGPGQTVGEMSLFASGSRSANVLTMERSTLLAMGGDDFRAFLETLPVLSHNLNRLFVGRLRMANQEILALASLDVAGRVAREILAFAEQYGRSEGRDRVHIPLRLTQGVLAAIVGTSRERVNQVMVRFKRRGYVSVDRSHHITVHDRNALEQRCGWAGWAGA